MLNGRTPNCLHLVAIVDVEVIHAYCTEKAILGPLKALDKESPYLMLETVKTLFSVESLNFI